MFEGLLVLSLGIGLVVLCAILGLIFGALSFSQLNTACELHQSVSLEEEITTFESKEPITACTVHVSNNDAVQEAQSLFFTREGGVPHPAFAITLSPLHQKELRIEVRKLYVGTVVCLTGQVLDGAEVLHATLVSRGKVH